MKTLYLVACARPNFVKIAPLVRAGNGQGARRRLRRPAGAYLQQFR